MFSRRVIWFVVALVCAAPLAAQKSARLSRLEARGSASLAPLAPTFSPDGAMLFFAASVVSEDAHLFSVPVKRAEPEVVASGAAGNVAFSRDGRWLAYLTDGLNVRAVSASGAGRRLAGRPALTEPTPFAFTPDSTRIVYLDEGVRVAPLDESAPAILLAPSSTGSLYVTPDSTRLVYYADGFHSVRLDGSAAPVSLTAPIAQLGPGVEFSADSSRFLYSQARSASLGMATEWFSVSVLGGTPVQLSAPLDPALQVIGHHVLVPGKSRLVYRVLDYLIFPGGPAFTGGQLRSAPLDGAPDTVLVGGFEAGHPDPLVGADGWLVYTFNPPGSNRVQLFRQRFDGGGEPKVLNAPLVAGGNVHAFALTPDGARAVYVADQDVVGRREVYVVPVRGDAEPVRLSAPSSAASVFQLAPLISSDGRWVVFAVDAGAAKALHSAPIDGSAPARELVSVPGLGLSFTSGRCSPDGRTVVYFADPEGSLPYGLYSVAIDGSAAPVRLSAALPPFAIPENVVLSPRGDRLAFTAADGGRTNLFLVPTRGPGPAVGLVPAHPGPLVGDVDDFDVRGPWAVYRADALEDRVMELFAAPLDGSQPPRRVSRPLPLNGDVEEWVFVPGAGAERVVYRADQSANGRNELFVVTPASRFPASRLHPPLGTNRSVEEFALDPLGSSVVYRADQAVDDQIELYRAPLDSSGASARLNAPLVSGGDVQAFALDPTGARVVYRADQAVDGVFELFGRPLDGSAPAVRLTPTPVAGGDVLDQAVDPSGTRVVYRADQTVNDVVELHCVAIAGTGPALRLSAPLVAGGDVIDYVLDPLGVFAVYRADQDRDEVRELYAVPLDGSSAPLRLNPAIAPGVAAPYVVEPGGGHACFAVDPTGLGDYALYSSALDGSTPPLRLSPAAAGRFPGPFSFRLDPAGSDVFFQILATGLAELWRAPLDGSGPAVRVTPPGVGVVALPEFSGGAWFYSTGDAVFRVPLAGGPALRVTPLAASGSVRGFRATPQFVVYRADHAVTRVFDLWSSALPQPTRASFPRR